jgi:hypothetical protein
MMIKRRHLAVVVVAIVAAPLLVGQRHASAATAVNCAGSHTWTLPNNSVGPIFSATESETWNRSCANVSTGSGVFGALTVTHDINSDSETWSGDCAFSFSAYAYGGLRLFIGPVNVGVGHAGTSAAAAGIGVFAVPSTTPCTVPGSITWSGVENYTATPF